jgi:hypothetical protein
MRSLSAGVVGLVALSCISQKMTSESEGREGHERIVISKGKQSNAEKRKEWRRETEEIWWLDVPLPLQGAFPLGQMPTATSRIVLRWAMGYGIEAEKFLLSSLAASGRKCNVPICLGSR